MEMNSSPNFPQTIILNQFCECVDIQNRALKWDHIELSFESSFSVSSKFKLSLHIEPSALPAHTPIKFAFVHFGTCG